MRIVFEFVRPPTGTLHVVPGLEVFENQHMRPCAGVGACSVYGPRLTEPPPEWPGMQAEVTIHAGMSGDVLHLEGDAETIKAALASAHGALDAAEARQRKAWAERRPRIKQCPDCGQFVETRTGTGAFLAHPRRAGAGCCPGGEPWIL